MSSGRGLSKRDICMHRIKARASWVGKLQMELNRFLTLRKKIIPVSYPLGGSSFWSHPDDTEIALQSSRRHYRKGNTIQQHTHRITAQYAHLTGSYFGPNNPEIIFRDAVPMQEGRERGSVLLNYVPASQQPVPAMLLNYRCPQRCVHTPSPPTGRVQLANFLVGGIKKNPADGSDLMDRT